MYHNFEDLSQPLVDCYAASMRDYDQIADWYAATRNPRVGAADVQALARRLTPGARVLDLGCGNGVPISRLLIREGFDVVGLDSSPKMLERYEANFPGVATRCERVQEARFTDASLEAVVAWGILFHLSKTEQAAVIPRVSKWLKPGGTFLFTAGDCAGTAEGEMNGVSFWYVSLDIGGYARLVERAEMHLEDHYRDEWENCVYIARRTA